MSPVRAQRKFCLRLLAFAGPIAKLLNPRSSERIMLSDVFDMGYELDIDALAKIQVKQMRRARRRNGSQVAAAQRAQSV
jgi:hypothetical protein